MKAFKARSDRAFQIDQWLALHQQLSWVSLTALAMAGAAAITLFAPKNISTPLTIALAIGLMLLYVWASRAPLRVMPEWTRRLNEKEAAETPQACLDFLLLMERKLPSLKRKELAYPIAVQKAVMLNAVGRKEDALELLRSFRQIWDPRQKEYLDKLIQKISGPGEPAPDEPKEQS